MAITGIRKSGITTVKTGNTGTKPLSALELAAREAAKNFSAQYKHLQKTGLQVELNPKKLYRLRTEG